MLCDPHSLTDTVYISSIIRQEYSWDRFKATREIIQGVLSLHEVFAPFLDCIHSFGFKTEEDDEAWYGHRSAISDRWKSKNPYYGERRMPSSDQVFTLAFRLWSE